MITPSILDKILKKNFKSVNVVDDQVALNFPTQWAQSKENKTYYEIINSQQLSLERAQQSVPIQVKLVGETLSYNIPIGQDKQSNLFDLVHSLELDLVQVYKQITLDLRVLEGKFTYNNPLGYTENGTLYQLLNSPNITIEDIFKRVTSEYPAQVTTQGHGKGIAINGNNEFTNWVGTGVIQDDSIWIQGIKREIKTFDLRTDNQWIISNWSSTSVPASLVQVSRSPYCNGLYYAAGVKRSYFREGNYVDFKQGISSVLHKNYTIQLLTGYNGEYVRKYNNNIVGFWDNAIIVPGGTDYYNGANLNIIYASSDNPWFNQMYHKYSADTYAGSGYDYLRAPREWNYVTWTNPNY